MHHDTTRHQPPTRVLPSPSPTRLPPHSLVGGRSAGDGGVTYLERVLKKERLLILILSVVPTRTTTESRPARALS
jgi:hypothetical protein